MSDHPRDFNMPTTDDVIGDEDTVKTGEDGKLPEFTMEPLDIDTWADALMRVDNKTSGRFTLPDGLILDKEKIDGLLASFDSIKQTSCSHSWKTYTGLNTMYEYCEVCDAKKNERKG